MPHYLAFTIGPIGRTFSRVRYTRELWAASYTFSYLTRQLLQKIATRYPDWKFVVPAVTPGLSELWQEKRDAIFNKTGAGIVPDRFIVQVPQKGLKMALDQLSDGVLEKFSQNVSHFSSEKTLQEFKSYFQLYSMEIEIDEGENVILEIMKYLDTLELQRNFQLTETATLATFFGEVNGTFLSKDGFGKRKRFPTLLQIATKEFANVELIKKHSEKDHDENWLIENIDKKEEDQDKWLVKALTDLEKKRSEDTPQLPLPFLPCYKYVAIVQADGDNVGKVVATLNSLTDYQDFSAKLFKFSKEAIELIDQAGGLNVYAGGDDLLFFAPVRYQQKTILDLLVKLDESFKRHLVSYTAQKPSLSFGVSVAYYKSPLYESLEEAGNRLFGVAKKFPDPENPTKNALALYIEKNSGQGIELSSRLTATSLGTLRTMLNASTQPDQVDLSGIAYDLRQKKTALLATDKDETAIDAFFENNFDEAIHKAEGKAYLEQVKALLNVSIHETDTLENAIEQTFSLLRIYQFFTSTELK